MLQRLRSARWKARARGRETCRTHRRPRSQRHSRKEEEREESALVSYDGSKKMNNSFPHSSIVGNGGKSKSYDDDEHGGRVRE